MRSSSSFVLFVSLRSPLKDDIAWLLYVARRWLAGRELYVDVVEVNPPLIIWLSAIPLTIARWLDVDVQTIVMPFFIAVVLGCAWWAPACCARVAGCSLSGCRSSLSSATVLLLIPAGDLGQREHLLVAAFLPYLVLFARALDGRSASVSVSVAAGVLAGLGCALKPRYGAVFAVLEGLAALRAPALARSCRSPPSATAGLMRAGGGRLPRLSAARRADGAGAVRRHRRAVPGTCCPTVRC